MKIFIRQHPIQHDGGVYFLLTRVGDTEALTTFINNKDIDYAPKHYWKNAKPVQGLPKGKYVTAQYVAESIKRSRAGRRSEFDSSVGGSNLAQGSFIPRNRAPSRGASE